MSGNRTIINAGLNLSTLTTNNTLNAIIGIDGNNDIRYRDASSVGNNSNQNLNTSNSVTFNSVTTNAIYGQGNALDFLSSSITYYGVSITTTNNTPTTIFSLATTTNTNYLIYSEIAAKDDTSGGGASFIYTVRVTNNGTTTLETGTLENVSSKTTSNSISAVTIALITSGTTAIIRVTGVAAETIGWTGLFRVIKA